MAVQADLATLRIDRTKARPRVIWPWVLGAVVILFVWQAPNVMRAMQGVEVAVSPVIKASTLSMNDGGAQVTVGELAATGYVVADRRSALAIKLNGQLKAMHVAEAQHVKKGELIAEIDSREIDAQIKQMESEVAAAQVEVEHLKAQAAEADAQVKAAESMLPSLEAEVRVMELTRDFASKRMDRNKVLAEQKALATSEVEDREIDMKIAQARIDSAKGKLNEQKVRIMVLTMQATTAQVAIKVGESRVQTMSSRIGILNEQKSDTRILAPYDGVVIEKVAEVGEIVAPVSVGGAMARGSICTLADWNSLQAEVDVAEAYIGRVRPGARVQIVVDALPGKFFAGKVLRILPRADRSKATVQVRVSFVQLENGILPDMGLRVKFLPDDAPKDAELGPIADKLLLSKKALPAGGGQATVWVVEENKALRKKVTTEALKGTTDWLLIIDGLTAGENVVIKGAELLETDGQKVKLVEAEKK